MEKLLKLSDVAAIVQVHKMTMASWVKKGIGPVGIKSPTGTHLFKESDVERWLETWERI